MYCILIDNPGPHSRLVLSEQKQPTPGKEHVLVRVRAAALNRADLMQRQGKYPPPPGESIIPGLEIAGEVVGFGSDATRFNLGDRIYGLVAGGAYAEYCCVHQDLAELIPNGWDFTYAAAIPEALTTTHATVFLIGQLKQGQTLLIHAAGSGLACFAIQMARYLGANVISTTNVQEKISKALQLGATTVINSKDNDFATLIGDQSIDVIVDFIGGTYFPKHLKILKPHGRLVQIACMQGHHADCDLLAIMKKRLQINGFVLRPQSIIEKITLWKSAQQQWSTALLNQSISPIIDSEFRLEEIEKAHARMLQSIHFGKIVIRID